MTIAFVSVRTSEMLQHIAGVSSSVCVTPGKEIELRFLSPVISDNSVGSVVIELH